MKTKKLFLIIALVVSCAVGAHAQKTVFKFRDAQARAGDAVTEVCVKPTVVEVKILDSWVIGYLKKLQSALRHW